MLPFCLTDRHWYVMRDLRRTNARVTAYHLLMQYGYEAFTPMTMERNARTGIDQLVPIMHWLLFVHATKQEIDLLIDPSGPKIPHLQYIYERGKSIRYGGMVVDDNSMNYFRTALARQEIPIIYRYSDITPDMRGRRVLITRGDMIGYQGCLQRFSKGKKMRLFVELDGFCIAPIQVSPEDISFLDNPHPTMTPQEERVHYTRLSHMVDIINYLRFAVPQDLAALTDEQLMAVQHTYALAEDIFDSYRVREHLCVDEFCRDRIPLIDREIAQRTRGISHLETTSNHPQVTTQPWVERMTQLCQLVHDADKEITIA